MKLILRKSLFAAILVAPLVSCFWFVATFGTNLPYQDDWALISEAGQLLFHETSIFNLLNHQHNDHRMGLPYLFLLVIGLCSGWNWVAMMQANVAILSLTNILLLAWAWARLRTLHWSPLILLPISIVVCNFRQWENLLFAFQTCVFSVNLFFLLSIILLERSKGIDRNFALSLLSAVCACNCNGNGLLTFPLGLLAMILQWRITNRAEDSDSAPKEKQVPRKKILIWLTTAVSVFIWFFHSYQPQGYFRFKLQFLSENPVGTIKFFLGTFGTLFANDIGAATRWGIFFLVTTFLVLISCFKRRAWDRFSITACMIVLFGLSFDVLVFLGRVGLALDPSVSNGDPGAFLNALCSRYATNNSLTLIGLYVLVLWSYRRDLLSKINAAFISALIACCVFVSWSIGIPTAEVWRNLRLTEKSILANHQLVSESSLKRIYPWINCMEKNKESLEPLGFFHFSREKFPSHLPCTKETAAAVCDINGRLKSNGLWLLNRETDVSISGWAFDTHSGAPASAVWIFIDGKPFIRAAYGLNRPEVGNSAEKRETARTGFAAVFSPKQLESGRHEVTLKVISSDAQRCFDSGPVATVELP